MGESKDTFGRIDRFLQSLSFLGLDLAEATAQEQGIEPSSDFAFLDLQNHANHATHYYRKKLEFCKQATDCQDSQFRKKIKHFVASKADLIFKLKGKERLQSGIDYNVEGVQEGYSVFAKHVLPIENAMQLSNVARRAQVFELLKVGDIVLGKVVGKRPFGVFVRILSLVHGRNLDFDNIDVQALCPKSELENDHKSREHLDPIDDFDIDDIVQGVICSVSKDEERIAISFRSVKLPSEYGNIELGIIEDVEEHKLRLNSFDDDLDYNEYLRKDAGFSNPTNVQTLIDVLGIDSKPPCSLLRSCQRWTFNDNEADRLKKQQSKKWSMDTTAIGVENFKNGHHEKALKYFNHALQIYDENSEALVARGALYANQNRPEYAIKDFKQALKLNPKHHNASKYLKETLFEKGTRLKSTGSTKEAIAIFEEVLDVDPDHIESRKNLKELKALLTAKLVEEETKARKAANLVQENRKKFEHVRKLIKSDPDVVKSSRKKKKKKKKGKKMKSKKRRRRSESSTTNTASEGESSDSNTDEWVEKNVKKLSPRRNENVVSDPKKSVDDLTTSSRSTSRTQSLLEVSKFMVEGTGLAVSEHNPALGQNVDNNGRTIANIHENTLGSYEMTLSESKTEHRIVKREGGREQYGSYKKHSRSRSRSREKRKERTLKNTGSGTDNGQYWRKGREDRYKNVKRRTSSLDNSSDNEQTNKERYESKLQRRKDKSIYDKSSDSSGKSRSRSRSGSLNRSKLRMIRGQRSVSQDSRGRRSISKDSRGRRSLSKDRAGKNRSRSRSSSLKRDRSRIGKEQRSISRDSKGRRGSNRKRSISRSSSSEKTRLRRGGSTSMDNRE